MKKIIAQQYNPAERINELDDNTDERYGGDVYFGGVYDSSTIDWFVETWKENLVYDFSKDRNRNVKIKKMVLDTYCSKYDGISYSNEEVDQWEDIIYDLLEGGEVYANAVCRAMKFMTNENWNFITVDEYGFYDFIWYNEDKIEKQTAENIKKQYLGIGGMWDVTFVDDDYEIAHEDVYLYESTFTGNRNELAERYQVSPDDVILYKFVEYRPIYELVEE